MDLRCGLILEVVFDDDFALLDAFQRHSAQPCAPEWVILCSHANVGQHMLGIGDGDRIGIDIVADNFANGGQ
ncbi:hypothetical protein D3C76_1654980 [compost metagenome]